MKILGKIIKHAAFALAALMIFISIAAAVWGYEIVDPEDYRLLIKDVEVSSKEYVSFNIFNHGLNDFNYLDLHSFSMEFNGIMTTTKFSHTLGQPLAVMGVLDRYAEQSFNLPFDFDRKTAQQLKCGKAITIELFNNKGVIVGKWTGIPKCTIEAPRPDGLLKITDSGAEFNDGAKRISWVLMDYDRTFGKVLLEKTVGVLEPRSAWYSEDDCPDVEGGNCMTEISIMFSYEDVFVTLHDRREGTSVTLSRPLWSAQEETFEIVESEPADMVADTYDIEVTEADSAADVRTCIEGCAADNSCYEHSTHHMLHDIPVYCEEQTWLVQKNDGKSCDDDYECASGICKGGTCGSVSAPVPEKENWLVRLLLWIDNLI